MISKYAGELVETSQMTCRWNHCNNQRHYLNEHDPKLTHIQFACHPPPASSRKTDLFAESQPREPPTEEQKTALGKKRIAHWNIGEFPDWDRQTHRFLVPCMSNNNNYWYRDCKCTNLGLLFRALGKKFSAAKIYSFYLSRRIVAVKKKKDKPFLR